MRIGLSKAKKIAQNLYEKIGCPLPGEISIEEVAQYSGAMIEEKTMKGAEGRILIYGDNAVIAVNDDIEAPAKRNFVIAHELGHFYLHKDKSIFYKDTKLTLQEWRSQKEDEKEANIFASEFLMPSTVFKNKTHSKEFSLSFVDQIAEFFGTSRTSTLMRFANIGHYSIMIVFSESGIVKWKAASNDFPFQFLQRGTEISRNTMTYELLQGIEDDAIAKVNSYDWFPDDFNIEKSPCKVLNEQCFRVTRNGLISLIWVP